MEALVFPSEEELQVAMGGWLGAHTDPEARIATNDIGAIGFLSRRFIIDTEGLVIAEPSEAENAAEFARIVKLAVWADEARTELAPHPREETGLLIVLSEAA